MAQITIDVPSGKNWKTTLFGLLTAAGAYFVASEDSVMKIVGQVLMIAGPVLMGFFAKDSNVTGGTVAQSTPPVG
jgi:hypothetical protein